MGTQNCENAHGGMEGGSDAAALEGERMAVAGATALQGAFGTSSFKSGMLPGSAPFPP